ncbi:putative AAA family ATPase [Gregarina niphandrodes]|uniref:AAA family ATPase n=1 Tax=Gregarina niphandrodes TaxID=110365 RepID=A0A023B6R8_GRENI|nr:putative AAA family ATPase [Gregarina niphandrodes]EZG66719.1 putative AAA family ATPase [Gregarina niphandrodes]|eukprot:XP_011130513.1 putative AAA family ATPase [Gregarina niphandrodes]
MTGIALSQIDPEVFERAAKAIREINDSKDSSKAYELALEVERRKAADAVTEKAKHKRDEAKLLKERQATELAQAKLEFEQERKRVEIQLRRQQELERFKAQLDLEKARQITTEMKKQTRVRQEEERRKLADEILAERQKAEIRRHNEQQILKDRQSNIKKELELQTILAKAKAAAEGDAEIKKIRATKDIRFEELSLKAKLVASTSLELGQALGSKIGKTVGKLINLSSATLKDSQQLRRLGYCLFATVMITKGTTTSIRILEHAAERSLFENHLLVRRRLNASPQIAPTIMKSAMRQLIQQQQQSPWGMNILLYGPPGTGKTTFAKHLALCCGRDVRLTSGGGLVAGGQNGVKELEKLLSWAQRRKAVLFIDEADAFLQDQQVSDASGGMQNSEQLRGTLSMFLERTGDSDQRFLVVLATNRPELLPKAIQDRVDVRIPFVLPDAEERAKILHFYLHKYLAELQAWQRKQIPTDNRFGFSWRLPKLVFPQTITQNLPNAIPVTNSTNEGRSVMGDAPKNQGPGEIFRMDINKLVSQTEGWSGRQIEKFCRNYWLSFFSSAKGEVDDCSFDKTVDEDSFEREFDTTDGKMFGLVSTL